MRGWYWWLELIKLLFIFRNYDFNIKNNWFAVDWNRFVGITFITLFDPFSPFRSNIHYPPLITDATNDHPVLVSRLPHISHANVIIGNEWTNELCQSAQLQNRSRDTYRMMFNKKFLLQSNRGFIAKEILQNSDSFPFNLSRIRTPSTLINILPLLFVPVHFAKACVVLILCVLCHFDQFRATTPTRFWGILGGGNAMRQRNTEIHTLTYFCSI